MTEHNFSRTLVHEHSLLHSEEGIWDISSIRKSFSNGECVALVQATTSVGHTSQWAPGPRVVDLHFLNPGTVIANFVFDKNGIGRFPNRHGYHAALFSEFGGRGMSSGKATSIWVMDR